LGFALLAVIGANYSAMVAVVVLEQLAGGMGTAAFVALLMALCNARVAAAQFALLSALAAIPRTFLGPPAAILVMSFDWSIFFVITAIGGLPGIWLVSRLSLPEESSEP
ncbi:MAG: PAT family beta-lactamase induction signal transducer AmpG, partial [Myxococcota bacterium]